MRLRALDCYYDAEDDSGYDGCDDEVPNRPAQERRRIDLVVIPVVWFVCHDLPPYPSMITTDSASTLFYCNHTKGTDGFRTLRKELGKETM